LPNTERQGCEAAFSERPFFARSGWVFTEAPQLGTKKRKQRTDTSHFTLYTRASGVRRRTFKEGKWRKQYMARIAGVDLPREKRVEIGLTYIYGIGRPSAIKILEKAGVNPDTRVRDLTDEEIKNISSVIDETMTVEGDLRREIALNIKRLQEIGCYRGIRHRKGLPVRGQKTKTNARTRKGPKRTVANKKK